MHRKFFAPAFLLVVIITSIFGTLQAQDLSGCPETTPLELIIGEQARVLPGGANRVRSTPTTSSEAITVMEGGSVFNVIGGPECADGYRWWQIDYDGQEGWTVEGDDANYFLEPVVAETETSTPTSEAESGSDDCTLEPRLQVGQQANLTTTTPSRVRDSASTTGTQVGQIQPLDTFDVLEGPVCAEGINWWRVSVGDLEGWTAEGLDGEYFTEPIIPAPTAAITANTATPAPAATIVSGCTLEPRLIVGQEGRLTTTTPSRVRDAASGSGAQVGQIQPLDTFTVLEGPECVDGINWWRISVGNLDGWTAEGVDGNYLTEPIIPEPVSDECTMEPLLQVGSNGVVVSSTPIRLRYSPGTDGAEITRLNPQYPFTTLEGPVCAEGINWWRVSVVTDGTATVDGWIAEGIDGEYFVERIIPTPTPTPAYIGLPMPTEIGWNSDGSMIAVGTNEDGIFVFDTSDWSQPPTQILENTHISSLAFNPQEPEQAAVPLRTDQGVSIVVIDITSGEQLAALTNTMPIGWYDQLQFSDDGNLLAYDAFGSFAVRTMGNDGKVFSVRPPIENTADAFNFDQIAMSGDGTWMAGTVLIESSYYIPNDPTITGTPPVKLHSYLFAGEVGSENLIAFEDGRISEPVTALLISPDASMMILGDLVGSLRTYTRPEGSTSFSEYNSLIRGEPSATSNRIYAIAIDPNTGAIVTAEGVPNAVVRVFDAASLTQIAGFSGSESTSVASDLAFSPDGSMLAVIVDDTVVILDTSDYSQVAELVVRRN